MAPQIPGFFKIVLQHDIHSSKLELPTKFTSEHNGDLSDVAQLVVPDGRIWKVGLRREGDRIYLSNGFREFTRHYSVCHGHLLVFKYKGLSCFCVAIYDHTSLQIAYPSHNPTTGEEENNAAPASSSSPNQRSNTRGKSHCEYVSKCGIPDPRHFRSERPYFEIKLKRYNFDLNLLYVPPKISRTIGRTQVEKDFVWLDVGDGRPWRVSVSIVANSERMILRRLKEFYDDNGLKEHDICIFELVEDKLFKVFVFAAI